MGKVAQPYKHVAFAPSLPLAGGLALLQAHARSVLGTFIDKLDASAFKGASDLIQC